MPARVAVADHGHRRRLRHGGARRQAASPGRPVGAVVRPVSHRRTGRAARRQGVRRPAQGDQGQRGRRTAHRTALPGPVDPHAAVDPRRRGAPPARRRTAPAGPGRLDHCRAGRGHDPRASHGAGDAGHRRCLPATQRRPAEPAGCRGPTPSRPGGRLVISGRRVHLGLSGDPKWTRHSARQCSRKRRPRGRHPRTGPIPWRARPADRRAGLADGRGGRARHGAGRAGRAAPRVGHPAPGAG